jgi:hypothetical protein
VAWIFGRFETSQFCSIAGIYYKIHVKQCLAVVIS